jgi:outer membrane beta-barrel protein
MKHVLSLIVLAAISIITTIPSQVSAAEDSVYDFSWLDKDKEVYVLQNRKFRKKSKVYLGTTVGRSVSGAFIDSNEINFIAGFYFSENLGIELGYTKADGSQNKTGDSINGLGQTAFYKKIDTATSAMLMWSPFYSKINTFNKIFYYDWLFGAGVASITTQDNRLNFSAGSTADDLTEETETAFTWMTGMRFYFSQSWSTRIDFRAIHANTEMYLNATETEERLNSYYNFNIGINFAF